MSDGDLVGRIRIYLKTTLIDCKKFFKVHIGGGGSKEPPRIHIHGLHTPNIPLKNSSLTNMTKCITIKYIPGNGVI